jgi:nucleoside-diphosphate-sugar epimerase
VRCVAEEFGLPRPLTVPSWLLRPMRYAHVVMSSSLRVSTAKAERELDWRPAYPSAREGLAALHAGR